MTRTVERASLFSKLLRLAAPRRQLATFSAQFPPPDWTAGDVTHLHSVGTQTVARRAPLADGSPKGKFRRQRQHRSPGRNSRDAGRGPVSRNDGRPAETAPSPATDRARAGSVGADAARGRPRVDSILKRDRSGPHLQQESETPQGARRSGIAPESDRSGRARARTNEPVYENVGVFNGPEIIPIVPGGTFVKKPADASPKGDRKRTTRPTQKGDGRVKAGISPPNVCGEREGDAMPVPEPLRKPMNNEKLLEPCSPTRPETLSVRNIWSEVAAPAKVAAKAPLDGRPGRLPAPCSHPSKGPSESGGRRPGSPGDASLRTYPSLSSLNLNFQSLAAQRLVHGASVNSIDTLVEVNMAAERRRDGQTTLLGIL
ncbi:uncharacterized protein LOC119108797 [Pollicipes pollicipes]|uniref:uncharacterized protein LOC119108797 n=1 Tax=Pollicipes pollicipes TaxID=41117 RepID=UPI001884D589|nr:uncharacterized protein LOC119108797 [Pollicipes pollicipes]